MTLGTQFHRSGRPASFSGHRPSATPFDHAGRKGWRVLTILTPLLFAAGSILCSFAFGDLRPLLVALLFFIPAWIVVAALTMGTPVIRKGFTWLLSFYWFCAGLAAVWDAADSSSFISFVDGANFYRFLRFERIDIGLEALSRRTEGSFAVLIWNWAYRLCDNLGLGHEPYIGICINIIAMAGAGALASKILYYISGNNPKKYLYMYLLFSLNGLFILFAVTHLRDSLVCFFVTLFSLFWIKYLVSRSSANLFLLIPTSILCGFVMRYLRAEFQFLPIGLFAAAVVSLMFSRDGTATQRTWLRILGIVSALGLIVLLGVFKEQIEEALWNGNQGYHAEAVGQSSGDSLGLALVSNQPLPIRLIVGPMYVLLMPVPFWAGFAKATVYQIGKSLAVLFCYWLVPRLVFQAVYLVKEKHARSAPVLFLVCVFLEFLLAVSATSLENRHIAAFMPLIFVAILAGPATPRNYHHMLTRIQLWFFAGVVTVHFVWVVIKVTEIS